MTAQAPPLEETRLGTPEIAGIWLRHLVSLLFPLNALAFLWTGPHPWYIAPLFIVPIVIAYKLDSGPRVELRQPAEDLPTWPFDALVYLLVVLQLAAIAGLVHTFSRQAFFSIDMLLVFVVIGSSSGFSIITAHELIHRSSRVAQQLGRLVLATVCLEYFYTEHLFGHHVRVGRPEEDPATARFGEPFEAFYRRTVPGQIRSAWRLERTRLGDADMRLLDRRMLRNRLLHGVAASAAIAGAVTWVGGPVALAAFVIQAFFASRLLEAVNYFEHWGLQRTGKRVRPVDSWDTHAWFTYYGLTGLSRHADHHAYPKRPFQQLRVWDEAPELPSGYVGMIDMVMAKNAEFQQAATAELERRQLGPFADGSAPPQPAPTQATSQPTGLLGVWARLPIWARRAVVFPALFAAVSAGAWLETGGGAGLGAVVLRNAFIVVAFAAMLRIRTLLDTHGLAEAPAWLAAYGVLVAFGLAGERLF